MKKLILLALGLSSGTLFAQCFSTGTGIDGGYHATANTTLAGGTYQFTSFTIDPGVTVMVTGTSPLVVNCTGAVTINGTLSASGGNGVNGVTVVSVVQALPAAVTVVMVLLLQVQALWTEQMVLIQVVPEIMVQAGAAAAVVVTLQTVVLPAVSVVLPVHPMVQLIFQVCCRVPAAAAVPVVMIVVPVAVEPAVV